MILVKILEPDSTTKELLNKILTEYGVAFKKSLSKQELTAKVLELRRQLETRPTNGTCEAINGPLPRPDRSDEHTNELTIIDQDVNDLRYSYLLFFYKRIATLARYT